MLIFQYVKVRLSYRVGHESVISCLLKEFLDVYIMMLLYQVFLVRDRTGGDIYAMKVLRKDNIIKRNQVEHTKTERNVLGYVRHPFIVGLNMAFQTRDKVT